MQFTFSVSTLLHQGTAVMPVDWLPGNINFPQPGNWTLRDLNYTTQMNTKAPMPDEGSSTIQMAHICKSRDLLSLLENLGKEGIPKPE
jgi:hypothetical protein